MPKAAGAAAAAAVNDATTRCDRLACFNSNTRKKLQSVPYCAHVAAAAVGDGGGGATAGLRGILTY